MARVWLVEMWNQNKDRWEPTVGVALDRDGARTEQGFWRRGFRDDRFRIRSYARVEAKRGR